MQSSSQPRHAFLSYMREDKDHVDELQEVLEAAGVTVWRDTHDLWPGEDWKRRIRDAIKSDSLAFVACFSSTAESREKSYQYEELTLAVEEYRLRPPTTSWLFTVRFDDCLIPQYDLGGGRLLDETINRAWFLMRMSRIMAETSATVRKYASNPNCLMVCISMARRRWTSSSSRPLARG